MKDTCRRIDLDDHLARLDGLPFERLLKQSQRHLAQLHTRRRFAAVEAFLEGKRMAQSRPRAIAEVAESSQECAPVAGAWRLVPAAAPTRGLPGRRRERREINCRIPLEQRRHPRTAPDHA